MFPRRHFQERRGIAVSFPLTSREKSFSPSLTYGVFSHSSSTCPYFYYITPEVSSGTTGVDVLKNSLSYAQYFMYLFRIKIIKLVLKT